MINVSSGTESRVMGKFHSMPANLAVNASHLDWEPKKEDWNNLYLGKKVLDTNEQYCGTAIDILTQSESPSPEKILVQYRTFLGFDKAMMVPVHHICKITASTVYLDICKKSIKEHGNLNAILRNRESSWDYEDRMQLPFVL